MSTSIRALSYRDFLNTNKAMQARSLSLKDDPKRTSLAEIGRQRLLLNPALNCNYYKQKAIITPHLRVMLNLSGQTYVSCYLATVFHLADILYCTICFIKFDSGQYAAVQGCFGILNLIIFFIANLEECQLNSVVFDWESRVDLATNDVSYLNCQGLLAIADDD